MADNSDDLKARLEAAIFAAGEPLSVERLMSLFGDPDQSNDETVPAAPGRKEISQALQSLQTDYLGRGVELKRVGSGYRFQVVPDLGGWVSRLWQEKPVRYSRALLETLAIIAYRQPVTRAEIEEIRGVSVSTSIMKNLLQREWVKTVGHRDVPGRPTVYATTRQFLDHFNVASLAELPALDEIRDIADLTPEFDFSDPPSELNHETVPNSGAGVSLAVEDSDAPETASPLPNEDNSVEPEIDDH